MCEHCQALNSKDPIGQYVRAVWEILQDDAIFQRAMQYLNENYVALGLSSATFAHIQMHFEKGDPPRTAADTLSTTIQHITDDLRKARSAAMLMVAPNNQVH